jgi:hypothetical protein
MMIESDGATRRTVASFERYQDAEALINQFAQVGFPVEFLVVVGRDLALVEPVSYGPVSDGPSATSIAIRGMAVGALLGGLFGLLFGAFFPGVPALAEFLYWTAVGVAGGLLAAGWIYWFGPGRRHRIPAADGMTVGRYEVMADEPMADEALRQLSRAQRPSVPQAP